MEYIEINNLVPHPKNDYYFDDITGEKWDELLMSIQTNGIHTPILVTSPDKDSNIPKHKKIIISGHQRVRACIELGIKKIPYTYKRYISEDEMLLALIESNIIQRGVGNSNPLKLGRCLNELDRIYGIKRGNNQHSNPNNLDSTIPKRSKKDIATALELSQETLTNYQKLTQLDEELQEMLLNNTLTPTNGIKIAKKVPKEKQKLFAAQIKTNEKATTKLLNTIIKSLTDEDKQSDIQESVTDKVVPENQQSTKEIYLKDYEDYIKYGNGTHEDEIALNNLKQYANKVKSFAELAHEQIDKITFNMEELFNLLRNSNSTVEILEELRDNNLDFCVAYLNEFLIKDIIGLSSCLETMIESTETIQELANDDDISNCDDDGFLYNGAGKKIAQIENYKNKSLKYDYIAEDEENVYYAYDANKKVIGKVIWIK